MRKIIFGLFIVAIFGLVYQFYRWQRLSRWDGHHQLNLVIQNTPIFVVSIDPGRQSMTAASILPSTYLKVPYGYGLYRVQAIYPLGQLEGRGGELLRASVQECLGIPLDNFFEAVDTIKASGNAKEFKEILTDQLWQAFSRQGNTDLSRWDILRLWLFLKRLPASKITWPNLQQSGAFQTVTLPDGQVGQQIEPLQLDRLIGEVFVDKTLAGDGLSIAILNATKRSGLATNAARITMNAGGRVTETAEWPVPQEICQLYGDKAALMSYTAKRLARVFSCQLANQALESYRADLVIIFGREYEKKLFGENLE